jgi:uncharacterized membrane protein
MIYRDSHLRSLVKGITWRIVGTLDTMIISYFVTGRVSYAVTIGSVEVVTKTFLFYCHDQVWNYIPFGKSFKDRMRKKSSD